MFDLIADYGGVATVVTDLDMVWVAKPRLKIGDDFGRWLASWEILQNRIPSTRTGAKGEAGSNSKPQE
jgi:hypothetical protein